MSLGLSQNYITLRTIESGRLIHQNKLSKIKCNNQVKATCYLESEPFRFKIDNFSVKEFDINTGFIRLSVKNNLHHKLNIIYQIFDDIENEIVDTVYMNRKAWCNSESIPRYEFQEAYHQPIKIKNNETIISCFLNDADKLNLIHQIYKNKLLVSYIIQYDGFELSEYEIFPLIKIIDIKEKVIEFSKNIVEKKKSFEYNSDDDTDSCYDNDEIEIYPTDVETLEKPKECNKVHISNSLTNTLIDLVYNEYENENNDNNIIDEFNKKVYAINNEQISLSNENQELIDLNETQDFTKSDNNKFSDSENVNLSDSENVNLSDSENVNYYFKNKKVLDVQSELLSDMSLTLQVYDKKNNQKKKKHQSVSSKYVSKMELSKIKNSNELSKMLCETVENGYMSQLEKANSLKLKK